MLRCHAKTKDAVLTLQMGSDANASPDSRVSFARTMSMIVLQTICARTVEFVSMATVASLVNANRDSVEAGTHSLSPSLQFSLCTFC